MTPAGKKDPTTNTTPVVKPPLYTAKKGSLVPSGGKGAPVNKPLANPPRINPPEARKEMQGYVEHGKKSKGNLNSAEPASKEVI